MVKEKKAKSEIPLQNRGISGISLCEKERVYRGRPKYTSKMMNAENPKWREEGEYY